VAQALDRPKVIETTALGAAFLAGLGTGLWTQAELDRVRARDRIFKPKMSAATRVALYDGTVEGFDFPELRARSVQFHPEAGPGPHDAWPILSAWIEEVDGA